MLEAAEFFFPGVCSQAMAQSFMFFLVYILPDNKTPPETLSNENNTLNWKSDKSVCYFTDKLANPWRAASLCSATPEKRKIWMLKNGDLRAGLSM